MNPEGATVAHEFAHVQAQRVEDGLARSALPTGATVVEDGLARTAKPSGATDAEGVLARTKPLAASDVRLPADAGSLARPAEPTGATNTELDALAQDLKIPNYVPCQMKDELRGQTVAASECGIVNLQNTDQAGSHWVLYFVDSSRKLAYSSYSDPVPQELVDYLGHTPPIYTSDIQIQDFAETSCGYYCIAILLLLSDGVAFEDIVLGFKSCRFAPVTDKAQEAKRVH